MTYRPDLGFQTASKSSRVDNIRTVEDKALPENLVDTTNLAIGTHNYPSVTGAAMIPSKDMSLTGKIITAAGGTINITVWATNDEDLAAGDWHNVTRGGYRPDDDTSGNANITSTGVNTEKFAIDFDNLNYDYYYVEVEVLVSAVNTVVIKQRKKAL